MSNKIKDITEETLQFIKNVLTGTIKLDPAEFKLFYENKFEIDADGDVVYKINEESGELPDFVEV